MLEKQPEKNYTRIFSNQLRKFLFFCELKKNVTSYKGYKKYFNKIRKNAGKPSLFVEYIIALNIHFAQLNKKER